MPSRTVIDPTLHEVPRPIIARGVDYPDGQIIPPHDHLRHQLLHGSTGAVQVTTPEGAWVMPPQRALWIPAGTRHAVQAFGLVKMRSLYFAAEIAPAMPQTCQVLGVSPLMRALLEEAVTLPREYDTAGRDGTVMALILLELSRLPILRLSLPLPRDAALARRCHAFLAAPTPHDGIEDWCRALGLSRRSFTRRFRQETGLSFVAWRQQACVLAALPRLAAGHPVTAVALDMGYDNPAAFTTMFRRITGSPPRAYAGTA